ncbi:monocarboxylate transporter 12-like [Tubulanus polymorphus]|uniref:monocarboxylate transporter 12-like n=1 Tax=Tubulanus polymorphus TaxID=672921 RepID=UPI003DA25150
MAENNTSCTHNKKGAPVIPSPPIPPDGGWGWVVAFASFLVNVLVDGVCFSFGLFMIEFIDYYGESLGKTAIVGSVLNGMYLSMGPVVSGLANKFGCRVVTIVGSIVASLAFSLSVLSPNIDVLICIYGALGGFGFGLMYLPSIVMVGFYFEKRRALATGIAVCGSGIGVFIFAPLVKYLLDEYNWKGATWIVAGVVLNGCVAGALFRPLEPGPDVPVAGVESPTSSSPSSPELDAGEGKIIYVPNSVAGDSTPDCSPHHQDDGDGVAFPIADGGAFPSSDDATFPSPDGAMFPLEAFVETNDDFNKDANRLSAPKNPLLTRIKEELGGSATSGSANKLFLSAGDMVDGKQPPAVASTRRRCRVRAVSENEKASAPGQAAASAADHCLLFRSCDDVWIHSHRSCRDIERIELDMRRPLYRRDIFYAGSVSRLPEFQAQPDVESYVRSITTIPDLALDESVDGTSEPAGRCRAVKAMFAGMFDFSLLASLTFLVYGLCCFLCMIGFFVPFIFLPAVAKQLEIDTERAAFLLSILGITNTVGRVVSGWVSDQPWADCLLINNVALVIGGVATVLVPFCVNYPLLTVYACVFGMCIAAFVSLRSIIMVELMGLEKLTSAFGLVTLCQGLSTFIGAPIAGSLFDATGNYDYSFYMAGGVLVVAGVICFPLRRIARWEARRQEIREEQEQDEKQRMNNHSQQPCLV